MQETIATKAMRYAVILFISFLSFSLSAQEKADTLDNSQQKKERKITLFGRIHDNFTHSAIDSVFVTLMSNDSTVLDTVSAQSIEDWQTKTKENYYTFYVPARPQQFIIKASAPDYEDCYVDFDMKYVARNKYFELPWHEMQKIYSYEKELDEVEIVATKIQMVVKGDTIIYNADAFNVPQGSMLDALIRQMPGVELNEDGEIKVNGKKVDKLTLNGDDFMKGNNKVMLENLPYYTVKDVQVYHKDTDKNRYLGRQAEEKEYVMDVRLKRDYNRGFVGNVEVGYGTEDRYMGRAFGLSYSDRTRISVYGNINNVNEQRHPASDGEWDATKNPDGISNLRNAGADFMLKSKDGKKKDNLSVEWAWRKDENESRVASEQYLTGSKNFGRSQSASVNRHQDINISNNFTKESGIYIDSRSVFNYGKNKTNSNNRSATLINDPTNFGSTLEVLDSLFHNNASLLSNTLNRTRTEEFNRGNSLQANERFTAMKKLPWGDEMVISAYGGYNNNDTKTYTWNQLDYPMGAAPTDFRNQYRLNKGHDYNYTGQIWYNINFLNNISWQNSYIYTQEYARRENPLYRLDYLEGWGLENTLWGGGDIMLEDLPADNLLFSAIDENNSTFTGKMTKKNAFDTALRYTSPAEKEGRTIFNLDVTFSHYNENLHYQRGIINVRNNRKFWGVEPRIFFLKYDKTFQNYYQLVISRGIQPSDATLMVDYRDDSNPLAIRLGNPGLKNSADDQLLFNLRRAKQQTGFFIGIFGSFTYHENAVIQSYTYDASTGAYTYKPINKNGSYNMSASVNIGRNIDKKGLFKFEASTENAYSHMLQAAITTGQTEAQTFPVHIFTQKEHGTVTYKKGNLTLSAGGSFTWEHSESSLETFQNRNVFNFNYGVTAQMKLPADFYIATDIKMNSTRGLNEESLNIDRLLWNGRISRSFIKGKLTAILEGYDILHQLKNISYHTNSNGLSSVWTRSIPSYAMLHLQYKINIMPKKK